MAKMLGRASQWGYRDSDKADRRRCKNIERRQWIEDLEPEVRYRSAPRKGCRHKYEKMWAMILYSQVLYEQHYVEQLRCQHCRHIKREVILVEQLV